LKLLLDCAGDQARREHHQINVVRRRFASRVTAVYSQLSAKTKALYDIHETPQFIVQGLTLHGGSGEDREQLIEAGNLM